MAQMVPATFDGEVFRPKTPVELPPNTEVLLDVHPGHARKPHRSFIETALSLSGDGPPDLSVRVDDYLYGDMVADDE